MKQVTIKGWEYLHRLNYTAYASRRKNIVMIAIGFAYSSDSESVLKRLTAESVLKRLTEP